MCGRYALTRSPEILAALFRLTGRQHLTPRYNVAPKQTMPVVVQRKDGRRELVQMRWGLVPSWAKEQASGHRIARSETAARKPAFRKAMRTGRCLVPADGFYEWQKRGARKQPYFVHRADGEPMALAGLWEAWTDPQSGEVVQTFAILTTPSNEEVATLHERMPVVLEPEDFDLWLNPEMTDAAMASEILEPAAAGLLAKYPVSQRVGTVKNDDPSLLDPLSGSDQAVESRSAGLFDGLA